MSDSQKQKICLKHQLIGLAIDLNQSLGYEYKFICERCVQENYFSKNNILLINEVELELKSIKDKQRKISKEIINRKLEQLTSLETLIQNYIEVVKKNHQLVMQLISQQILQTKTQLEQLNESQSTEINEQEIKLLSLYFEKGREIDLIQQQQQQQDQEIEYFETIKNHIEKLFQNEEQKIIMKIIDEIQQSLIQNEENIEQKQNYSSADRLKYQCNIHNESYQMVTLETGNIDQRLFCLECVTECNYKYCSIKKMNGLWIEIQEQIFSKKYQFNQQRLQKYNEIQQIIVKLKEKQQLLLEEAGLISQNKIKKIQKSTELLKVDKNKIKSIFQMELEEIKEAANFLAQSNKMMSEKQYEIEIQNEDGIAILELYQKLELLNQIQIEYESQIKLQQPNQNNKPQISNNNNQTQSSINDLQETSRSLNQSCEMNEYSKDQKQQENINLEDNQHSNQNCSTQNHKEELIIQKFSNQNNSESKVKQNQQQNKHIPELDLLQNSEELQKQQQISFQDNKDQIVLISQKDDQIKILNQLYQQFQFKYQKLQKEFVQSEINWKTKYEQFKRDLQVKNESLQQIENELKSMTDKYNTTTKQSQEQQNKFSQLQAYYKKNEKDSNDKYDKMEKDLLEKLKQMTNKYDEELKLKKSEENKNKTLIDDLNRKQKELETLKQHNQKQQQQIQTLTTHSTQITQQLQNTLLSLKSEQDKNQELQKQLNKLIQDNKDQ